MTLSTGLGDPGQIFPNVDISRTLSERRKKRLSLNIQALATCSETLLLWHPSYFMAEVKLQWCKKSLTFITLGTFIFQKDGNKQQVASISGSLHQGLRFSSALQSPIVGLSSCRALPAGRPCSPSSTLPPLLQPGLSSLPQLPHRVPRSLASPGDYWPGT